MSDTDLNRLKVAELKEELKKRGLDTKGNKAQLVQKLKNAIEKEKTEAGTDEDLDDAPATNDAPEGGESTSLLGSSLNESAVDSSLNETAVDTSVSFVQDPAEDLNLKNKQTAVVDSEPKIEDVLPAEPEQESLAMQPEESAVQDKPLSPLKPEPIPDLSEQPDVQIPAVPTSAEGVEFAGDQSLVKSETVEDTPVAGEFEHQPSSDGDNKQTQETDVKATEIESEIVIKDDKMEADVPLEQSGATIVEESVKQNVDEEMDTEDVTVIKVEEGKDAKQSDEKTTAEAEIKDGAEGETDRRGEKRRRSRSSSRSRSRSRSRSTDRHRYRSRSKSPKRGRHSRSRSRSHDRSRSRERRHYRSRSRSQDRQRDVSRSPDRSVVPEPLENDDWITSSTVQLDRYNCDLSININDTGVKVTPLTTGGFAFMWHGVKATYGVTKGKVGFEIKILEHLNVDHLPPEEDNKHVVRVGFSTNSASTQLGEEKFSYGYGGTGKASVDCKFTDYGVPFEAGDAIGAYVDFESDPVTISFSKNGDDLGTCFEIASESLEGQALFPHVLTKNCSFECNFGLSEEPYFPPKEGFIFINSVPEEDRVRGTLPPAKKEDCEMIMMCGLPGSGKTTWVIKHVESNPDKRYSVLGTNSIIDKMKVMGLPRKRNYAGRWDVLIDLSTKCLNEYFTIAARKKRNYILDQTNVYPTAQRRKMRPFEGFQRTAVVLVPTDEEFKRRCEQREKDEGKEVPDSAVLEMKANFQLPTEGSNFDKVQFVELDRDEAQPLVEQYNREGKQVSSITRRFRGNDHSQPYDNRSNKSYGSYGSGQDRGRDNQRPWGHGGNRRGGGGSGGGGGGGGGGYYNRDNRDSGGYNNRRGGSGRDGGYSGGGGYGGSGGGGGYGGGSGGGSGGYRRNDRGGGGGGYQDRRKDQSWSSGGGYRDRRDNRGGSGGGSGGRDSNWGANRNSSYQQSSWKPNQGSGGGGSRNSYGQNQGSWGNSQGASSGAWSATNTGSSNWSSGQDWSQQSGGYQQQATWGQWTPYSQQPQQQQQQQQQQMNVQQQPQQQQAWNQQYWNQWNAYGQPQQGSWDYSQYNAHGGGQK